MNPEFLTAVRTTINEFNWLRYQFSDGLDDATAMSLEATSNNTSTLLDRVSKGIPLWSDVPDEYQWIAMDSDDDWFGHKSEPEIHDDEDWLQPNADWTGVHPYCPLGHKESAVNWRESLERRPDGAKYIKR
jgi:hypothetical protein